DPEVGEGARLLASRPELSVARLAKALYLSERQLRRRFDAAVGYGPKMLQRVLRFRGLLARLAEPGPAPDLARVASDLGYADQAHLTREARELAGQTPMQLARVNHPK
ncbi:MAG: helix-turn-helix domain-containing protein, partial [Actinomycetota bacterium]